MATILDIQLRDLKDDLQQVEWASDVCNKFLREGGYDFRGPTTLKHRVRCAIDDLSIIKDTLEKMIREKEDLERNEIPA